MRNRAHHLNWIGCEGGRKCERSTAWLFAAWAELVTFEQVAPSQVLERGACRIIRHLEFSRGRPNVPPAIRRVHEGDQELEIVKIAHVVASERPCRGGTRFQAQMTVDSKCLQRLRAEA